MMDSLEERARALGVRRVAAIVARLAGRIAEAVPGARVEASEGRVTIAGRGLRFDAALRWIGSLVR